MLESANSGPVPLTQPDVHLRAVGVEELTDSSFAWLILNTVGHGHGHGHELLGDLGTALLQPQHVAHVVQGRRAAAKPESRADRAAGKGFARGGPVGDLDAVALPEE